MYVLGCFQAPEFFFLFLTRATMNGPRAAAAAIYAAAAGRLHTAVPRASGPGAFKLLPVRFLRYFQPFFVKKVSVSLPFFALSSSFFFSHGALLQS